MRNVETRPPSFPEVALDQPIAVKAKVRWQVLCGDEGHWRVGLYAPAETKAADCLELERHDCPEFFLLHSGRMTLVISDRGKVRELPLEPGKPVLVSSPHSGFCPDGPHSGVALVVERDSFDTEYRLPNEW